MKYPENLYIIPPYYADVHKNICIGVGQRDCTERQGSFTRQRLGGSWHTSTHFFGKGAIPANRTKGYSHQGRPDISSIGAHCLTCNTAARRDGTICLSCRPGKIASVEDCDRARGSGKRNLDEYGRYHDIPQHRYPRRLNPTLRLRQSADMVGKQAQMEYSRASGRSKQRSIYTVPIWGVVNLSCLRYTPE